jgi:hypothetical protein
MNSKLKSPNQEPEVKTGEMHLINPSVSEFKTSYFDDNNQSVEVIIAPFGSKAFPRATGEVILRHLIDFIINQGGFSYKTDINLEKAEIRKKCILYE